MADIAKKPIKITETILRDAHQSLIATRMTTAYGTRRPAISLIQIELAPISSIFFAISVHPWERLRKFRDGFKNTKLQMLFRGQNILGYRPYADDVVEYFVQKSVLFSSTMIIIFAQGYKPNCFLLSHNSKNRHKRLATCSGSPAL